MSVNVISKYSPIFLQMGGDDLKPQIPFKFNNTWIENDNNKEVVCREWDTENTLTSTNIFGNLQFLIAYNSSTNRCLKIDFKCTFMFEFNCLLQLPGAIIYEILCNFQSSN